jgi:hypothetical protein
MPEFLLSNLSEQELTIVNKWPIIYLHPSEFVQKEYIDKGRIKQEEACNLRYGFEFNSGWLGLADKIGEYATEFVILLRKSEVQKYAYIKSCIFKEKFGGLTWQGCSNLTSIHRNIWNGIIRDIERESLSICENTGKAGTRCSSNGHWQKTLCREEAERLGYYPVNKSYQDRWKIYPQKIDE